MWKTKTGSTAKRGKGSLLASRCATIPGHMRAQRSLARTRVELEALVGLTDGGLLTRATGKGDVLANLWLVRAGHEYAGAAAVAPDEEKHFHLEYASKVLLPLCKKIVQQFITEHGMDGVRMDDGGVLVGIKARANPALQAPMRLNALWYAALEATGMALRGKMPMGLGTKDPSGDHFERLAGRFRRSFAKTHWCEEHDRICPPEVRDQPGHGELPDPEQVLLSVLPASPLPRTKQRGILLQIGAASNGATGVKLQHPTYGLVESMLHRAWLAQGFAALAEGEADRKHAAALLQPLTALREMAQHMGIHAFYKDGKPLGKAADPLATAEVLGALARYSV